MFLKCAWALYKYFTLEKAKLPFREMITGNQHVVRNTMVKRNKEWLRTLGLDSHIEYWSFQNVGYLSKC